MSARTVTVSVKMPQPGLMSVTVFKLTFRLKTGASAPHELAVRPVSRSKLPPGVAVFAVARLLKHSSSHTAVYVGMLAAIHSKTVPAASSASETPPPGDVFEAQLYYIVKALSEPNLLFGGFSGFPSMRDWLQLDLSPPTTSPRDLKDLFEELDPLAKPSVAFDENHAFAWSVDKAPTDTRDVATVVGDLGHSLDTNNLPWVYDRLDVPLKSLFPGWFGEGSLTGDPSGAGGSSGPTTYKYLLKITVSSASEHFQGSGDTSSTCGQNGTCGVDYSGDVSPSWSGTWDVEVYNNPQNKQAQLYIPGAGDPDYSLTGSVSVGPLSVTDSTGSFQCPQQTLTVPSGFTVAVAGGGAPNSSTVSGPTSWATSNEIQFGTYIPGTVSSAFLPCSGNNDLSYTQRIFSGIDSTACQSQAGWPIHFNVSQLGSNIHLSQPFSSTAHDCAGVFNSAGPDTYTDSTSGTYTVNMTYQGKG